MVVSLRHVTKENWYLCTKLNVKEEQLDVFPVPVVYWIAESKYVDEFELRAIYEEERLIGFLVYATKPDPDNHYWIIALMIDKKEQGNGYGKAALILLIELMREHNYKRIKIGHRPNSVIADKLYQAMGFNKVSDQLIDGEVVRLLSIE